MTDHSEELPSSVEGPQSQEDFSPTPQSGRRRFWIAGFLVVVAAGALAFLFATQRNQILEVSNRIAFVDSEGRLGTVSPDGTALRMLEGEGQFFRFPAWSPAGTELAVIGEDSEGGALFLTTDRPDNKLRRMYAHPEQPPIYLYWSPDGSQVSFISRHRDGLGLHVLDADGTTGARVVTTGHSTLFWHWTPDSREVFVHTGFTNFPEDETRLEFVPTRGNEEATEVEQQGFFQMPAVSPSGKYYAFGTADPMGNRWLIIHERETGKTRRIQPHQGIVVLGWSPSQPQLAFSSPLTFQASFYGPLRLIDIDTGQLDELVEDIVLAFFWSPDGRYIAYFTVGGSEVRGGLAYVLLDLSIIDVETGESRHLINFQPSAIFVNDMLPFFDNYAQSHRLWSPNADAIVIPVIEEGEHNQILVVPIDGSEPIAVAAGVIAFWSHQ